VSLPRAEQDDLAGGAEDHDGGQEPGAGAGGGGAAADRPAGQPGPGAERSQQPAAEGEGQSAEHAEAPGGTAGLWGGSAAPRGAGEWAGLAGAAAR